MISVSQIIGELEHELETCLAEEALLNTIESRLEILRTAYKSDKQLFTSEHISFLKNLNNRTCKQLRSFIDLKDELPLVHDFEEYTSLKEQLISLRTEFHAMAICQRISKEIRELDERLPLIQEQEDLRLQSRLIGHIRELEQHAPICSRGHAMVIREKNGSYFWGCSKYPLHEETRVLSPKEKEYLS